MEKIVCFVNRPPKNLLIMTVDACCSSARQAPSLPLLRLLLRASYVFAFFSIALISFDAFPYKIVGGFHPRLTYVVSLLGFICYVFSGQWKREFGRHRMLLCIAGAFLLYGLIATSLSVSLHGGRGLLTFTLLNYLERQIVPVGFMLWYAFLFSSLPEDSARKFFIAALMIMFFSNAAHMILELSANYGAVEIKNLLIAANPWFRVENAHWGNWPPPYYENRVRGLFGEPAHMAYAFTPVLAFFFYKLQRYAVYLLPLLFVVIVYCGKGTSTGTGVLSLGFLSMAFIVHMCYKRWAGRGAILVAACMLAAFLAVLHMERDRLFGYAAQWRTLDAIADYCRRAQTDPSLPPPALESRDFSRFFFRAISTRLEWDIARQYPFGIGYQLSGEYRKPLAVWGESDIAGLLRVRFALANQRDPVLVFPYFCEYTAMAAELGVIALAFFFLLCLYVGLRAYRRYRETGDSFILYMLLALPAFLLMLLSFSLRTGLMLHYFLGFLYSLGLNRHCASAPVSAGESSGAFSSFAVKARSVAATPCIRSGGE
ncbi:MAG: hypothetical protein LBD42_00325 [Desulfovibrio sp.]|nr:hypothetical protein [Desulfovibrio sp.]